MDSATVRAGVTTKAIARTQRQTRRRETILGLLFVAPATILTFIFGLFPVLSGFFISMQGGTILPQGFVGLRNYFTALGSLAYLLALSISCALLLGSYLDFRRSHVAMQRGMGNFYLSLLPGTLAALATLILLGLLFSGFMLVLGIWPLAILILAVGGYLYLNSREHGGLRNKISSWLVIVRMYVG